MLAGSRSLLAADKTPMNAASDSEPSIEDPHATFDSFWAFYLSEHRQPGCRALHYVAATLGLVLLVRAVVLTSLNCALCALPAAYAIAWFAHLAIEHNRPATWRYPLWSIRAEFRMCRLALTGQLGGELERLLPPSTPGGSELLASGGRRVDSVQR